MWRFRFYLRLSCVQRCWVFDNAIKGIRYITLNKIIVISNYNLYRHGIYIFHLQSHQFFFFFFNEEKLEEWRFGRTSIWNHCTNRHCIFYIRYSTHLFWSIVKKWTLNIRSIMQNRTYIKSLLAVALIEIDTNNLYNPKKYLYCVAASYSPSHNFTKSVLQTDCK